MFVVSISGDNVVVIGDGVIDDGVIDDGVVVGDNVTCEIVGWFVGLSVAESQINCAIATQVASQPIGKLSRQQTGSESQTLVSHSGSAEQPASGVISKHKQHVGTDVVSTFCPIVTLHKITNNNIIQL